jgi:uncharacterized protein YndB with AHSA1/START domain
MSVTDVRKDPKNLTMSVTTELDAPIDRVWRLWEDPRQLERWWGPPTYPATVEEHDLTPGGKVSYYMTGPEGDQPRGWWRVQSVEPPRHLQFEDGFADEDGNPNTDMPTMTIRVDIEERANGGTIMTIETTFPSEEAMQEILAMGAEEGMKQALGQIDELLEEEAAAK